MEYPEKESPVPLFRIEGTGNSEFKANEAGVSVKVKGSKGVIKEVTH